MLKTVSTANGLISPTFSGNVTLSDGNLVIGTSGKGIDFSATSGTGTSELLSDYEEGTWTPTDASGAGLIFSSASGTYTKVGRQVTLTWSVAYPVTANASAAVIGGLPFTASASNLQSGGYSTYKTYGSDLVYFSAGANLELYNGVASQVVNASLSANNIRGVAVYFT
jgi:hypothetical protein